MSVMGKGNLATSVLSWINVSYWRWILVKANFSNKRASGW